MPANKVKRLAAPPPAPFQETVAGVDISLGGTGAVELEYDPNPENKAGARVRRALFYVDSKTAFKRWTGELDPKVWTVVLKEEVPKGDEVGAARRVQQTARHVLTWLLDSPAEVVAMEDHAFNAKGGHIYQLGHLHGLIRNGINLGWAPRASYRGPGGRPYRLYDITTLKIMATGDAKADKSQMIVAAEFDGFACSRFGKNSHENLADAYWCARLLLLERRLRARNLKLEGIPGSHRRDLFRRTTKNRPLTLLEQPYITGD